jgi:hypothetical protein
MALQAQCRQQRQRRQQQLVYLMLMIGLPLTLRRLWASNQQA